MKEHKILWVTIIVLSATLGWLGSFNQMSITQYKQRLHSVEWEFDSLSIKYQRLESIVPNPSNLVIKSTDTIRFGNEIYTFELEARRERLQREVSFLLDRMNFVILTWIRSGKYFPLYDTVATQMGVSKDLRFVSIIESALDPEAQSSAKAIGLWQFMESLARIYKIPVRDGYDMRRDPELSTRKAFQHLLDLYQANGNWPITLACYNAGEAKVAMAIKNQGTANFFKLNLPIETKRYVFFVFALKIIFDNPDRFIPGLIATPRYQPFKSFARVIITFTKKSYVKDLARSLNIDIERLYEYNPALTRDVISPGEYIINIPFEQI